MAKEKKDKQGDKQQEGPMRTSIVLVLTLAASLTFLASSAKAGAVVKVTAITAANGSWSRCFM